ncbi:MAG TPA: DNA-processing protein DprA [Nannocystaceae bacterium]|nr:DNA-processing protein DprA [Nannocystaceae bacterium]
MHRTRPIGRAELGFRGAFELAGTLPAGPRLAIVGARASLHALTARVPGLVAAAHARGFTIVSGGAIGVDAAVHRAALAQDVPQLAVLPCGPDRVYPSVHAELFAAIAARANSGLLFARPRGATPTRATFVSRNAIVIALVDACVVLQAELRSGSETTGKLALRANKQLAAVPGTRGCAALIGAGAHAFAIDDDDALAAWLDGRARARAWPPHLAELRERLRAAGGAGATLDQLGGPLAAIVLFEAEALGLVAEPSPGRWVALA